MTLENKIDQAVKLLQSFGKGKVVEVCYSGGKDSDVILELVKMAGIEYRAIYKNTTIDPPHTIAHCKSKGVEIMHPKETFFNIIKKNGFPNRKARFCCKILKEYKIMDYAVQGIRRHESTARAKRYQEPIVCRIYGSKDCHANVCLPILDWTNKDIEQFIKIRGIQCHPLYYDTHGVFHVERRLGCLGCPLRSDKGVEHFKQHPRLLKRWAYCGSIWWNTHTNNKTHKLYGNVYDLLYKHLFCDSYKEFVKAKQKNLFGEIIDCKKYLEEYFKIEL